MQALTDWTALWHDLASNRPWLRGGDAAEQTEEDFWKGRARQFNERTKRRWAQGANSTRDALLARLGKTSTLLDIGAGTGGWAVPLAPHVGKVTAVEASPAMIEVMRENLAEAGISNVEIVEGRWPNARVEQHDFTLCAHAMYGFPDFPAFVQSVMAATKDTCFLLMRVPTIDGVMAAAAMRVWGHPYDSPNGLVAFNALVQMGLLPSFLVEEGPRWEGWTSPSIEDALAEVKGKLGVADDDRHDAFFEALLRSRLVREGDVYHWPAAMRSALIAFPAQP
jgi:SAM-dependent methyltransferase